MPHHPGASSNPPLRGIVADGEAEISPGNFRLKEGLRTRILDKLLCGLPFRYASQRFVHAGADRRHPRQHFAEDAESIRP